MISQELKFKNFVWVDLQEPEKDPLLALQRRFRFHDLDLEDCLSVREMPKMEVHDKHIFLIFKFPVFNKRTKLFRIEDLKVFIGKNFIITIHNGILKDLDQIFQEAKIKMQYRKHLLADGTGKFLWKLLKRLFAQIFPIIDKMSEDVRYMERDIFGESVPQNRLEKLLILKRNLITLRRILLPQKGVIISLEKVKTQFLPEHLEVFFDDILDKIEKQTEMIGVLQDLAESLREANETMLTHSLNNTMKVLTVFSAIMLPLTFITGVFGMNVELPLAHSEHSLTWILAGMFLLGFSMYSFFRWRKWL